MMDDGSPSINVSPLKRSNDGTAFTPEIQLRQQQRHRRAAGSTSASLRQQDQDLRMQRNERRRFAEEEDNLTPFWVHDDSLSFPLDDDQPPSHEPLRPAFRPLRHVDAFSAPSSSCSRCESSRSTSMVMETPPSLTSHLPNCRRCGRGRTGREVSKLLDPICFHQRNHQELVVQEIATHELEDSDSELFVLQPPSNKDGGADENEQSYGEQSDRHFFARRVSAEAQEIEELAEEEPTQRIFLRPKMRGTQLFA